MKELILQPQSEIDKVRRYLEEAGYMIVKEDMVFEDGKYYPVMKAELGEMHYEQEIFYEYGKLLLEKKHPVLKEFLLFKFKNYENILQKLAQDGKQEERMQNRIQELEKEKSMIQEALQYYEM